MTSATIAEPINTLTHLPFESLILTADFTGKKAGDAVLQEDGHYSWNGQVFVIEAGSVKYIWNDVDGQMEMTFE